MQGLSLNERAAAARVPIRSVVHIYAGFFARAVTDVQTANRPWCSTSTPRPLSTVLVMVQGLYLVLLVRRRPNPSIRDFDIFITGVANVLRPHLDVLSIISFIDNFFNVINNCDKMVTRTLFNHPRHRLTSCKSATLLYEMRWCLCLLFSFCS